MSGISLSRFSIDGDGTFSIRVTPSFTGSHEYYRPTSWEVYRNSNDRLIDSGNFNYGWRGNYRNVTFEPDGLSSGVSYYVIIYAEFAASSFATSGDEAWTRSSSLEYVAFATVYWACYDLLSKTYIDGYGEYDKEEEIEKGDPIAAKNFSNYTYQGYVYYDDWSDCLKYGLKESYDSTGTTCEDLGDSYHYIIFFYKRNVSYDSYNITNNSWLDEETTGSDITRPIWDGLHYEGYVLSDDWKLYDDPLSELTSIDTTFYMRVGSVPKNYTISFIYRTILSGSVTISGEAKVNNTLTIINNTNSTNVNYQWNRNDIPIVGATSSSYMLTNSDIGYNITCTVSNDKYYGTIISNSTEKISDNKKLIYFGDYPIKAIYFGDKQIKQNQFNLIDFNI